MLTYNKWLDRLKDGTGLTLPEITDLHRIITDGRVDAITRAHLNLLLVSRHGLNLLGANYYA
jgi:hypothetical protein